MKSKNIAIWLNINPICATGKSIIMKKKISICVIVVILKAAEILEQLQEKNKESRTM